MAAQPHHEIRRGMIVARIRIAKNRRRSRYAFSVVRIYRNGDQWKESSRLGLDDLPLARLALDEAHRWALAREARAVE